VVAPPACQMAAFAELSTAGQKFEAPSAGCRFHRFVTFGEGSGIMPEIVL